jgi:hypothetical protein
VRLACDLDGVLADLHTPFVKAALTLFPHLDPSAIRSADVGASPPDDAPEADPADRDPAATLPPDVSLSRRETDAVWRHLLAQEDFWESLDEIEHGLIARLAKVADERRWEVLFITSRPKSAGRTIQRQSQRWLEQKGFPLPSLYVVHGSRGRVAAALDIRVVIDDRPDNCLDVVLESKASAVLVWRGSESSVPQSAKRLGIAVVPTVAQCLDTLIAADAEAGEGGVVDRLKRLFGVRSTKSALSRER